MNKEQLINELKQIYSKYFPNSTINISNGFLGNCIFIKCYLAKDKTELASGYFDNDLFSIMFYIDFEKETKQIECNQNSYLIKPRIEYMCYSNQKVSFRKSNKITQAFENFIIKLKDSLKESLKNDEIPENFKNLLIKKI